MSEFQTTAEKARQALAARNPHEAFAHIRGILTYPGRFESTEWEPALRLFADVARAIAGEPFAQHVDRAAANINDVKALYDLGYHLYEQQLPAIAATVLARANHLAPHVSAIITELVGAFENHRAYAEACRVLADEPALLAKDAMCQYLMAFNTLMCGDLPKAAGWLSRIRPETAGQNEPQMRGMIASVREMIDAPTPSTPAPSTSAAGNSP